MFTLGRIVAKNASTNPDDMANIKFAMTSLGYYDDAETGLSPYGDERLFKSVQSFQKDNDLKTDGVIKPEGPTQKKIKDRLKESAEAFGAFKDFTKNYIDLKISDTIGADKYFHCKANYEATSRGWKGEETAKNISDSKEKIDRMRKKHFGMTKFSNLDSFRDQGANIYGREAAKSGKFKSARKACSIFRPKGLDEKY